MGHPSPGVLPYSHLLLVGKMRNKKVVSYLSLPEPAPYISTIENPDPPIPKHKTLTASIKMYVVPMLEPFSYLGIPWSQVKQVGPSINFTTSSFSPHPMGIDEIGPRKDISGTLLPQGCIFTVVLWMNNSVLTFGSRGRGETTLCPEQDSILMEQTGQSPELRQSHTKAKLEVSGYSSRCWI